MGEMLVIETTIFDASVILRIIKDPNQLFWDWGPEHLDVAARWLPNKGFRILPKLFDANYKPGSVGDEGDKLIMGVRGCYLRTEGEEPRPIWCEQILEIPETKDELSKFIEGNVLDMSFEEEVAREMEVPPGASYYKADEQSLKEDNETLRRFGKILTMLWDCRDQVRQTEGPLFFKFYIPR